MPRQRLPLVLPLAALLLGGCDDEPTEPADPVEELVTDIRNATTDYQQVTTATASGYAEASPCVESPDGGMGFHYMNQGLMDATIEPTLPELLLFEPEQGGGLRLVGVEYMIVAPDWDAANTEPPTLVGQVFDDHRAEETRHGIPFPHYDLHVWAWESNPNGLFTPFNPNVSCAAAE